MEPFILVLKEKRLFCKNKDTISPVGDNSDYTIKFEGVSKTAVFAVFNRDGKTQKIALDENKEVLIPMWVLKKGSFEVGLYSDGFASTATAVYVRASVMEDDYEQTEDVPQSMVDQLIELVNKDISSVEETKTQAVAAKNAAETANEGAKTALESITSEDGYLSQIKGYAEAAKADAISAEENADKIQGAVSAANEALAEAKELGQVANEIIGEGGTFAEPKDGTALKQIRDIKEAVATAQGKAEAAQTAAETAQAGAETAQGKAEAAQTAAETAQAGAETAQGKAEAAQTAAETAQSGAKTAQGKAEAAQTAAETAKTAAETAQGGAQTAQDKAEKAQTAAETAKTGAVTAQSKAKEAQTAAETAQTGAEKAQTEAQAAQIAAVTAQAGAQTAQSKAEAAQTAAETAQGKAEAAQTAAETAKAEAQDYAEQAYQTVFGDAITTALAGKVDKEDGKGLSSNDFTDDLKTKLDGVAEGANNYSLPEATADTLGGVKVGANLSIGEDGTLSADAQQIAVDEELSDTSTNPVQNKVIYEALGEKDTAISKKVDKETGKGLSSNDFTDLLKTKLDGVAEGANKTVTDDELSSTSTNPIQNCTVTVALSGKASATHSHGISEVTNLQTTLDGKASSVHNHSLDEISETDSKKILTSQERTKLAGIAEGANNYSLPVATASTRGGVLIETAVTSESTKAVTSGAVFARIGNLKFAVASSAPTSADENTITFVT